MSSRSQRASRPSKSARTSSLAQAPQGHSTPSRWQVWPDSAASMPWSLTRTLPTSMVSASITRTDPPKEAAWEGSGTRPGSGLGGGPGPRVGAEAVSRNARARSRVMVQG